jgi:hypothetical protein
LADRAGSTRTGYNAENYIYESIISPDAFLAPGFPRGIMPDNHGQRLSEQEIADLTAFLMEL